jgi:hypothetical protein
MGDFEPMNWERVDDSVTIRRYAVLTGSTIYAYNNRDCIKYRQQTAHDLFFTQDDIMPQPEDGIYRVQLNKGDWEWFEVDTLDLCDIKLSSRRKELERNQSIDINQFTNKEILNKLMNDTSNKIMSSSVCYQQGPPTFVESHRDP